MLIWHGVRCKYRNTIRVDLQPVASFRCVIATDVSSRRCSSMDQEISQSSFSPVDESWSFLSHPSSSSLMLELPWLSSNIEESKNDYETPLPTHTTMVSADSEPSELAPVLSDAAEGPAKRRGRKPGLRQPRQPSCHVEVERQRREKMNRRFCELRAAVPTVSRMDKSSLLGDAADYITKLRARVGQLEAELRKAAMAKLGARAGAAAGAEVDDVVEARMVGADMAVVRVTSPARHAPASLMAALRSLDLEVRHASVSRVYGVTTMDAAVDVPSDQQGGVAVLGDDGLRTAILQKMQEMVRLVKS
ncbi:unnamed protein product [Urochloa decumbens]|uniref:Transcription factor n=2 Tax=Urochloa decumbens TaxID=240449 RepID=A0ABC9AQL7_9POAL